MPMPTMCFDKELFTDVYICVYCVHIYETKLFSNALSPNLQHRFLDWHLTRFEKDLFVYSEVEITWLLQPQTNGFPLSTAPCAVVSMQNTKLSSKTYRTLSQWFQRSHIHIYVTWHSSCIDRTQETRVEGREFHSPSSQINYSQNWYLSLSGLEKELLKDELAKPGTSST